MNKGTAVIALLIAFVAGYFIGNIMGNRGASSPDSGAVAQKDPSAAGAPSAAGDKQPSGPERFRVMVGRSPAKGSPTALVTIVEFSEFECPFCSRVGPTLKKVQDEFGDKVRVVFKHNPLPFHKNAMPAAQASAAANLQGKFWEYHDKLFANQKALGAEQLEAYAKEVGLDVEKWKTDKESEPVKRQVQADMTLASRIGAQGTPNFFINGRPLQGAQPYDAFAKLIKEEITNAEEVLKKGVKPDRLYAEIVRGGKTSAAGGANDKKQRPQADDKTVYRYDIGNSPVKGPSDALVTIIEVSEFQCPFCKRVLPTLKQIENDYKGKVRFSFKHNPLPFHNAAMPAALAGVAAAKQGKFWEFHDKLFDGDQKGMNVEAIDKAAQDAGLDMAKYKADKDSEESKKQVAQDQADSARLGARGTPSFFINGRNLRGAQPFDRFKAVIDEEITKAEAAIKGGTKAGDYYASIMKTAKEKAEAPAPRQRPGAADPNTVYKVTVDDSSPSKGPKDALITIVEFSEFQCPFCSRVLPTLKEVEKLYEGKVRTVFKHQPLPFHKDAPLAAEASMAANEQGKFWEMHDKMFANQKALGREQIEKYGEEIGLNMASFKAALDSGKYKSKVQEDSKQGSNFGARGTPSFFINGKPLVGAQPLDAFKARIDAELKTAEAMLAKGVKKADLYNEIMKTGKDKVEAGPAGGGGGGQGASKTVTNIEIGDSPSKGPSNAPITIVEFSEFQCPFCTRVLPTLDQVQKTYGDKVRLVFKHFPLPFHKDAPLAAQASMAAYEQGKFWEMHDLLFANQKALKRENLDQYAQQLGLDMGKFKAALDSEKYKSRIEADSKQVSGIGTPTFYINGRQLVGAQPFDAFKTTIDEELAKLGGGAGAKGPLQVIPGGPRRKRGPALR